MSEFKTPRQVAEIQNEYQGLCTKLGHLEYQLFTIEKDVVLIKESLRDLNFEAAASHKAANDAKAKEDAEKKAEEAKKETASE